MNHVAPSIQGRGGLDIVDAQFHLSHVLGSTEVIPVMDALGIRSLLIDELWGRDERDHPIPSIAFEGGGFRPISPLGQAAATRYPDRFSYLQRLNRHDPHLAAVVEVLASSTGCRAVRASMRNEAEWQAFREGGYDRILELAQRHRLPIFIMGRNAGRLLRELPRRYPELSVIVDHCGWLDPAGDIEAEWKLLLELGQYPQMHLKWCHANHVFRRPQDGPAVIDQAFRQALAAFTPQRIMWASDTTHDQSKASWSELLEFVRTHDALGVDDRSWVLGKTARQVLRWNP